MKSSLIGAWLALLAFLIAFTVIFVIIVSGVFTIRQF